MAKLGNLIIYGAGGHGLVVADAAASAGWDVVGFVDDNDDAKLRVEGRWQMVNQAAIDQGGVAVIVAIGDLVTRQTVQERLVAAGVAIATVVHSAAWVSSMAELGSGVFVGANATVQAKAVIGDGVIVNTGAVVEHDCVVGQYVHVGPGAVLCGGVTIGEGTFVGANAAVRPNVRVGREVTVGMNAAVVGDVWDGVTVVGVPGKGIG